MIYPVSMTSFGRGASEDEKYKWLVEIRSVNHKYLDLRFRMPRQFNGLEERLKKEITNFFSRGHIEINISLQSHEAVTPAVNVNLPLARKYQKALQVLEEQLEIRNDGNLLSLFASFPGIVDVLEEEADLEAAWPSLCSTIRQALVNCREMREREGEHLKKDISSRLDLLEEIRRSIQSRVPELNRIRAANLNEKIASMLGDKEIEPARLAQEAAILVDKADVTEELVRLDSHLQQFQAYLNGMEPAGRKLDFLLQEFLREINTIASKISSSDMAHQIVEMKNEVEKIREQIQNIE